MLLIITKFCNLQSLYIPNGLSSCLTGRVALFEALRTAKRLLLLRATTAVGLVLAWSELLSEELCTVPEWCNLGGADLDSCLRSVNCLHCDFRLTCPKLGSTMCEHFGAASTIAKVQYNNTVLSFVEI